MIYNNRVNKLTTPLVSIVITNYNYNDFVGDAINSVQAQTYSNFELVIIDDGSTDGSVKTLKDYASKNKKIRLIEQPNKGVVPTRNRGIEESKGEYMLYLDADDKIPETYIEVLVSEAQKKNLDVVYCNYRRFGQETSLRVFPEFDIELIKSENIVHMSSLIKKSSLGEHRFDDKLNKATHEDWDFFLGLALSGLRFGKAADTELLYRSHGQSRSNDVKSADELNKQGFNLFNTYMYIINKYKQKYPGKIDLTENSEVISWWRTANERFKTIQDYRQIVEEHEHKINELEKIVEEKNNEILRIRNSVKYKVGSVLTYPVSMVKSVFHERRKK